MSDSYIDTEDYIFDSWKDKQIMNSYENFYVHFYIKNVFSDEFDVLSVILGELSFNNIINSIETLDNTFVRIPEFKRNSDYHIRVEDIVRIESTRISIEDIDEYKENYF